MNEQKYISTGIIKNVSKNNMKENLVYIGQIESINSYVWSPGKRYQRLQGRENILKIMA